jgi:signal transduction histidine kinase
MTTEENKPAPKQWRYRMRSDRRRKQLPRFEIAAAVVFRLGEELITDVVQALVELVKNSYDADATWSHVTINTPKSGAVAGSPEALGEIVVEDDGHGMNEADLKRGWLMIADSAKKKMKDNDETTKRNRTPVGDKGLGRLGVQRLGYDVEIISRVEDVAAEELRLAFSWRDFLNIKKLGDVPVQLHKQSRSRKRSGTRIVVRDLKDAEQWVGEVARNQLKRSLSELISPFREVRDFSVTVTLDGDDVPIAEIAELLRDTASVKYEIDFNGTSLNVTGKVKLDFVERAQDKIEAPLLRKLLRKDDGQAFFNYLKEQEPRNMPPQLEFHEDSKWFVSFKYTIELEELGGVRLADGEIASPGAFHGEVDYLMLDQEITKNHIWDSLSDYKQYVKELSGIRVYRNGFGIRLGEDWLQLGRQSTSGGSLYGLRPKNVIGFLAISARENKMLLETTSREGFQDTTHFRNFYELLQKFIQWTGKAQEYLRRGALGYVRACKEEDAGIDIRENITSVEVKLREYAASIDHREQNLAKAKTTLKLLSNSAQVRAKEITDGDSQFTLYHQDKLSKVADLVNELNNAINKIQEMLDEQLPEATSISKAQQILDIVLEREKRLQQELEMFYEGVALGLTAEALSHEISGVADHLSGRASALGTYLSKQETKEMKVISFIEFVRSSVGALRKQLSHLDPSLRYLREKRDIISVSHELNGVCDFYKDRFSGHAISMCVLDKVEFEIMINRGKLSQIIDNILLNSEYWLREARRKDATFVGEIVVEIERTYLRIWDNGPGVALSVEDNLFDPFVTTKEQGKGRGLGLFIVQQLLDSVGCTISLLPERNHAGRRFKFEIDLRGALNG